MSFFDDPRAVVDFVKRYEFNRGYRYIEVRVDGRSEFMFLCYQYNRHNNSLLVQLSVEYKFQFNARFANVGRDYNNIENIEDYMTFKELSFIGNYTLEDTEHLIVMAKLADKT